MIRERLFKESERESGRPNRGKRDLGKEFKKRQEKGKEARRKEGGKKIGAGGSTRFSQRGFQVSFRKKSPFQGGKKETNGTKDVDASNDWDVLIGKKKIKRRAKAVFHKKKGTISRFDRKCVDRGELKEERRGCEGVCHQNGRREKKRILPAQGVILKAKNLIKELPVCMKTTTNKNKTTEQNQHSKEKR